MSILRVKRTPGYTTVPNRTLHDKRLSFRSRGVLTFLLAHPDDWEITTSDLSAFATEGRDAIRTSLAELREIGYVEQFKESFRDSHGRTLWRTVTLVKDAVPETDSQAPESVVTENGFPGPALPTTYSSTNSTDYGTTQSEELRSSSSPAGRVPTKTEFPQARPKRGKRAAPPVDDDQMSAVLNELAADDVPDSPPPVKHERSRPPQARSEVTKAVDLFTRLARKAVPDTPGATNERALGGSLSQWNHKEGVNINFIARMIEVYWSEAFQRSETKPAWQDFLAQRGVIVAQINQETEAATVNDHRYDSDYWTR